MTLASSPYTAWKRCIDCGGETVARGKASREGRCDSCYNARRPCCSDCGKTITMRGKTGRCQPCSAARTVAIERMKQAAAIRRTPLAERYGPPPARR